jgi:hypothetical protein
LTVYCKTEDEVGVDTLIGEYIESGNNHSRKCFKRREASDEGDEVFLYYWDSRDGAEQQGWWFGDSVGGSQVWSRNQSTGALPPSSGWRVPWEGPIVDFLCVEQKKASVAKAKAPLAKGPPAKSPVVQKPPAKVVAEDISKNVSGENDVSVEERFEKASDRVSVAETEAVQALESAKATLESDPSEDGLKSVETTLQAQQKALSEVARVLGAESIEIRKKDPKFVAEFAKLNMKLRGVTMKVNQDMANAKKLVMQRKKEVEEQERRAKVEEDQFQAEQRDAKLLEEGLPTCMDLVTHAEDSLDAVVAAAQPLERGLEEDMVDEVNAVIKETEAAVAKARGAVAAASKELRQKRAAAEKFAPEARKVALAEYTALLEKATEAQTRLNQYANVRKDWEQKHESKRVMAEVTTKLGEAEAEVEKFLTSLPADSQPSEEHIKAAEAKYASVLSSLLGAIKFVDQKVSGSAGALKQDLMQMKQRGQETKEKVERFRRELRTKGDQIQLATVLQQCTEITKAAEDAFGQLEVAEAPFLKGVEGIPESEAQEAIKACEEAAKKIEIAVGSAKGLLKTKHLEIRRYPDASKKETVEEMGRLQERVDSVSQKVIESRRETASRKMGILLQELLGKATEAEVKLKAVAEAAQPLHAEKIEELSLVALKEAVDKTLEAEKAAAVACAEAKKAHAAKQKESSNQDRIIFSQELQKVNLRLNAVSQELAKERKVVLAGEKLYKIKKTVQERSKEMEEVEAEVERVEILTTPVGDERPSNEAITEMDAAVESVQKKVTDLKNACDAALKGAQGVHKEVLEKTLARAAEAQTQIDEIKATTREQSERVQCEQILVEAKRKVDRVEEAFLKAEQAEAPYLKGLDALPVEEATKAVVDSEAAIALLQQAIAELRTYLSTKSLELRRFMEAVSKPGLSKVGEFSTKNDEFGKRLDEFKQETEGRKRAAKLQEAAAKVDAVEAEVKRTTETAAPLMAENSETMSQNDIQELCENVGAIEKAAREKLDDSRTFLLEVQKQLKTADDRAAVSKLLSRLNGIQVDLGKARKAAEDAEQKVVAKFLMADVSREMQELESQVEKACEAAQPLVDEGGRDFLVASMTKMLVDALSEHIGQNGGSKQDLYTKMTNGATDTKATEAEFVVFFAKVPELCSRPDLAFSSDQLGAVFDLVDEDADGALSQADFLEMFCERFICNAGVSLTDIFNIQADECKTLCKIEVGDILEAMDEPKAHDSLGISRMQVKKLPDGVTGWVTLQGNQGTTYLEPFTAYAAFMLNLERCMTEAQGHASKASASIKDKVKELKEAKEGPLHEAKEKLTQALPKVSVLQAKLDQLKTRVEEGKREHTKREDMERRKAAEKKR